MGCLYSQFGAIEFQQGHEIYRRLQKQHLLQLTNPAIIRSAVPLKVNTGLQQGGWDCRSYSKGAGTTGPTARGLGLQVLQLPQIAGRCT